jgi:hypothetical protein
VSRPFLETPHLPSIYLFRQPVRRRHDRSRGIVNPAFPTLVKRKGDSPRSSAGRAGSLSAAPAGTSGCRRDYPPAGAGRPRLAAPPPARPPGGALDRSLLSSDLSISRLTSEIFARRRSLAPVVLQGPLRALLAIMELPFPHRVSL